MKTLSEFIVVTKLRETTVLEHGRIQQIFDAVNCPGLCVVCTSTQADDGDLIKVSEVYEFGRRQFDRLDDALMAWGDLHQAEGVGA